MSYTTSQKVRQYLAVDLPQGERVLDQLIGLTDTENISFHGGPVMASTLVVKSPRNDRPKSLSLTLTTGANAVSSQPLMRAFVTVASDSSLGTLYTENLDYIVDYGAGELHIKSGGALAAGMKVTIWYHEFFVYQPDTDYQLDAERGRLRRSASGQIATGETVVVDYTPQSSSLTEELVDTAVVTANGLIERQVDPDVQFEADPTLVAAATFRALEIVSLAAASRNLGSRTGTDKTALAWLRLAEEYDHRAVALLASFRPPLIGPASPVHS